MNDENVTWVISRYPGLANHPLSSVREHEYRVIEETGRRYGREITMDEFDLAIAERFGEGMEYEWPRSVEEYEAAEQERRDKRAAAVAERQAAYWHR